jgi:hypothetical protein
MTSSYTSKKIRVDTATQFLKSFEPGADGNVNYVFIARHIPWPDEPSPELAKDTIYTEKDIWNNLIAAKKITSNDVEIVIPRREWLANVYYRQYDDTITLDELLTANDSQELYPMYIMNSERNVYKCLSNGASSLTSEEPLGENLSNNGNIVTSDGYIWKYLYNIDVGNVFLSNNWIPVPSSTDDLEYNGSSLVTVDGEITTIAVDDPGLGYLNSNVEVAPFETACSVLIVSSDVDISNTIFVNMGVSGTGIVSDTYITGVNPINRRINLSFPTISPGGGSANLISISTRAIIQGDGEFAFGTTTLSNTGIEKITLTNYGLNYTWSNVIIYGTATGDNVASVRAIISPKFGHGFNSAKELGGHNVIIALKIGEVDTTEGGILFDNINFRQYGLLRNPYKYGELAQVTYANANTVVTQTLDVTVAAGDSYITNDFVYQGNINDPTFSAYVGTQTSNVINLTNVRGTLSVGIVLKGTITSGRTVVSIVYPEFEPYTGDILYDENIEVVERENGQAENIKFVVKF